MFTRVSRHRQALNLAEKETNTSSMTNDGRKPAKEKVKCLCLQMSGCLLFIGYVERSTDAAANEKTREERETPDVL